MVYIIACCDKACSGARVRAAKRQRSLVESTFSARNPMKPWAARISMTTGSTYYVNKETGDISTALPRKMHRGSYNASAGSQASFTLVNAIMKEAVTILPGNAVVGRV